MKILAHELKVLTLTEFHRRVNRMGADDLEEFCVLLREQEMGAVDQKREAEGRNDSDKVRMWGRLHQKYINMLGIANTALKRRRNEEHKAQFSERLIAAMKLLLSSQVMQQVLDLAKSMEEEPEVMEPKRRKDEWVDPEYEAQLIYGRAMANKE